ncbi:hypothetical protein CH373_06130 [Leptospira perolatii]|uniref:Fibronectin type-III domain-containing protein n=1 Tax=Leptospira perolatii TaxID=2023191 RepID=A0A2M9ZP26_9LEPT|nr:hypothetical protein [Leptospira perolatii]PJZ70845.1 hypothetical protein CH360_04860 [Leptospira perolatii]PJZ73741.1 hypothetical protein CH373_06130 [Leptospira perolatii]
MINSNKLTQIFVCIFILSFGGIIWADDKTSAVNAPTTGPASQITQTSAVLSAKFVPGGSFATIGWGKEGGGKPVDANCGPLPISSNTQTCTATGLTCNTKYGYLASEILSSGKTATGKREYFTTAPCN